MRARAGAVVSVFVLVLSACSPSETPSPSEAQPSGSPAAATCHDFGEGPLAVQSGGGLIGQAELVAYEDPFTAECGVAIEQVVGTADTAAVLAAQFEANNIVWDVIGTPLAQIEGYANNGWLEEIDRSLYQDVDESTLLPKTILDFAVGYEIDAVVLAFKQDLATTPASWVDFFDPARIPGTRLMGNWGVPDWNFISAELAAGIPREELTPFDYDAAFAQLDKIKDDLLVYESGSQMVQMILNNEAVMCQCTDGRVTQMNRAGGNMAFSWQDAVLYPTYWAIVKNAPHPELAQFFVRSTVNPVRAATFTSIIGYPTMIAGAVDYLPADLRGSLSTAPENFPLTFQLTPEQTQWIADNHDEINARWNDWLLGP